MTGYCSMSDAAAWRFAGTARRWRVIALGPVAVIALSFLSGQTRPATEHPIEYGPPVQTGVITHAALNESSGVAWGRRNDLLWTHNDSGDGPHLYGITPKGELAGRITIEGAAARDWEDMAAFEMDEQPYLLAGDVGDNDTARDHVELHLIEEPDLSGVEAPGHVTVRPEMTIQYRYEDGPHNCESVAVDATSRTIVLLSKELWIIGPIDILQINVYALPLPRQAPTEILEAQRIATLRMRAPTGADISPDGQRLIIATYLNGYEFTRHADETWADAMRRAPRLINLPMRAQGESICYGADGRSLYLTSEQLPSPVWKVPAKIDDATDDAAPTE